MPTPEIDLVAFNSADNELVLVEVKSFLDSDGVEIGGLNGTRKKTKNRYRLLNNFIYQKIVTEKLRKSFIERKFINEKTIIKYALAAGRIYGKYYEDIQTFLNDKNYYFYKPSDIAEAILDLKKSVYLNDSVMMKVKLLRTYLK